MAQRPHPRRDVAGLAALLLVLTACSGGTSEPTDGGRDARDGRGLDGAVQPGPRPTALVLTPENMTLDVPAGAHPTLEYFVSARFADGHTEDNVPATLTIDVVGAGEFQGRTFVASGASGGVATVTANYNGASAHTQLTVRLNMTSHDPAVSDEVARRVLDLLPQATADATLNPAVVYPYDQTVMPPNLYGVEWQWRPVASADIYVLTIATPTTLLHHVAASNMVILPNDPWRTLMNSNHGRTAEVTVRATRAADPSRAGSASVHVVFGSQDLAGGIYYFTTNERQDQQGIFRYDFGVPSRVATRYLSQSTAGGCVGCHVLSHDGQRMMVTFEGGYGFMAGLQVSDPSRYVMGGPRGPARGAFGGFLDEGQSVVTVFDNRETDPHTGELQVADYTTGVVDPARAVPIGAGHRAAHIDVAPDGRAIVYVDYADVTHRPIHEERGTIRVVSYDPTSRQWGVPRTLVEYDGTNNNYYPSYSPDGEWIMFNRAPGDAYDNRQASVWVVPVSGARPPIQLVNANHAAALTNSWPRWAPFVQTDELGTNRMWLTFSSKRDYGLRLAGVGRSQIWMAAFSPAAALNGTDGSAPAFWLPFQDMETQNHTANWTTRVVPRNCERTSDCQDPNLTCNASTRTCETVENPG